jgi:hypothetical protein
VPDTPGNPEEIQQFITRWKSADGSERANYQLFLTELCALLDLPHPHVSSSTAADNHYVFERHVTFNNPDGTQNSGFIDLYRRDSFVCEAKQTGKVLGSQAWDAAMIRAFNQAQRYARALPAAEGRPPFLVILDVGRALEIYSEFSRSVYSIRRHGALPCRAAYSPRRYSHCRRYRRFVRPHAPRVALQPQ